MSDKINEPFPKQTQPPTILSAVKSNIYGEVCYTLDGEFFRRLLRPGVYFVKRRGGEFLYIGSSCNLLARVSNEGHRSLREALMDRDCEISMIPMVSEGQAREIESQFIAHFKPMLNIIGKSCPSPFEDEIALDTPTG